MASLEQLLAIKLVAGRARDHADIVALARVLQVNPAEAAQLALKAYGADALEALTTF